jgi:hypothetical protein
MKKNNQILLLKYKKNKRFYLIVNIIVSIKHREQNKEMLEKVV